MARRVGTAAMVCALAACGGRADVVPTCDDACAEAAAPPDADDAGFHLGGPCPYTAPVAGSTCEPGQRCKYDYDCPRVEAVCVEGRWVTTTSECPPRPELCPLDPPKPDASCSSEKKQCHYYALPTLPDDCREEYQCLASKWTLLRTTCGHVPTVECGEKLACDPAALLGCAIVRPCKWCDCPADGRLRCWSLDGKKC